MNQKIVKEINRLQVERMELRSSLKDSKLNKDAYIESGEMEESEIEDLEKEIAAVEAKITDLSAHLKDEDAEEDSEIEE